MKFLSKLLVACVTMVGLGSQAFAQGAHGTQVASELATCGNGTANYVNVIMTGATNKTKRNFVSLISTPAGQGYNTSQAGVFIAGIPASGVTISQSITYRVKPLNGSVIGCLQGPFLRDIGTATAYPPYNALNAPGTLSTVSAPDADGFSTVSFTTTNGSFNSPSLTFFNLGLITTNGGSFLVTDFAIDGVIVPVDTAHHVSCPFGVLSDLNFSTYCGGP